MVVRRGDIWWCNLPSPRGSEPGYRRPVVVVQCDALNKSRLRTVLAVIVTSNLALAKLPGNVRLTRKQSGLPRESVVNVTQLITIDRDHLTERNGNLPHAVMERIDAGLRLALSL